MAQQQHQEESIKETLISIIISFALAFVARSYVAEPYVIPTGSMAPTLLGAHMRFHSRETGYQWPSNPHDYTADRKTPLPVQGSQRFSNGAIEIRDPMSRLAWPQSEIPRRAGDRILVQKYLFSIRSPKRWEVIVFKGPEDPKTNFIKRLVGLPNENVVLIDGDVFSQPTGADGEPAGDWRIQRKPDRVQGVLWTPMFSSEYTPMRESYDGRPWRSPWLGRGWTTENATYRWPSDDRGVLQWDLTARPITDSVSYNWTYDGAFPIEFPVSDLRLRAAIEPDSAGMTVTASITARSHVFEAVIGPEGDAVVRMRPADSDGSAWTVLGEGHTNALAPGSIADIAFSHVDQRVQLVINDKTICEGVYDWSPEERLAFAMTNPDPRSFANPGMFKAPSRIQWTLEGSAATVHRVGVDRDLHYQSRRSGARYDRASALERPAVMGSDQFFVLGDNSPFSLDARMWTRVDPWVAMQYDNTPGIVPRSLIMGRAFFVYFPAPHHNLRGIPVPDIGRLRFIR